MTVRILCPFHEERTPSMVLYPNGGKCFGCGKWASAQELSVLREGVELPPSEPPEDVREKIAYISQLPKRVVRGLELPYDALGYYIVWPDSTYYKLRVEDAKADAKYLGPRGLPAPPLILYAGSRLETRAVLAVEGEFNALAAARVLDSKHWAVCSPGSASAFYSAAFENLFPAFSKAARVCLVADNDAAGTLGILKCKQALAPYHSDVKMALVNEDFNEVLVKHGPDELRARIEKIVGV